MCQNKFDTYGAICVASAPRREIDTYELRIKLTHMCQKKIKKFKK
ncbi:MAG TPA: hypothetical protein PLI57_13325 [Spirochaetota bacterium]|nr:hypothetical protein [Spirochaetota bacterium]